MDDLSNDDDIFDGGGGEKPPSPMPMFIDNEAAGLSLKQHEIIEHCVLSRRFFAEVVLDISLETWQGEVLDALDSGETRISVRSGNGAGKTMLCAIIGLHYLLFRNDVKIPVTAPASSQLRDGLIPEMNKWIGELPDFLKHQLKATEDRIVRLDNPANNFISFRTARKETPEALAGIHATFVLCIVDEASGVPDIVYEYAQGTLSTPGAIFIMISNPTRLNGFFYNSHNRLKRKWKCFHVTSFDTSRVDYDFVQTIRDTYGLDSNQYRVKVKGEFPTGDDEALISRAHVEAAVFRDVGAVSSWRAWGLDCGRGGDVSALLERNENVVSWAMIQNYSDTMQTVGWVHQKWKDTAEKLRPESIYVDSIGIGAGVADRLRELDLPAIDVNVSELPSMKKVYVRMRDELWHVVKDWFEGMTCSLQISDKVLSDMIVDELCAPLAIFTSLGKNGVESKSQMRSRGVGSPNLADALCLTFAHQGSVGAGVGRSGRAAWNKPLEYTSAPNVW